MGAHLIHGVQGTPCIEIVGLAIFFSYSISYYQELLPTFEFGFLDEF